MINYVIKTPVITDEFFLFHARKKMNFSVGGMTPKQLDSGYPQLGKMNKLRMKA